MSTEPRTACKHNWVGAFADGRSTFSQQQFDGRYLPIVICDRCYASRIIKGAP